MEGSFKRLALPILASVAAHATLALELELPRFDAPTAPSGPTLHVVMQAPAQPSPPAETVPRPEPQIPEPEPAPEEPPERASEPEPLPPEPPQLELQPSTAPPDEPKPLEEMAKEPEPDPQPEPEPEVATRPEPAPVAEPEPVKKEPDRAPTPPPEPVRQPEPSPEPEVVEPPAPAQTAMVTEPAVPSAAEEAASEDYFDALRAYLERHKRYPRRALMRRQEGTVLIRFTVNRGGDIVSLEIAKSSGNPTLDREAEAMLERATPLPAIPDEINADEMEIEVPVSFSLG